MNAIVDHQALTASGQLLPDFKCNLELRVWVDATENNQSP
jgi:hypothetical protein